MSTSPSRWLLLVVALSVAGACGSDDSSGSADDEVAATTTVAIEVPATESPVTDPAATDPALVETTTVPEVGGCPVGTWLITTEALQEFYDVVNAAAGTNFSFAGQVLFTLGADLTFTYDMTDFTLTNTIGDSATTVTLVGAISGTYEIVDGTFATTIVDPNVTATVVSAGATVDGTTYLQQFLDEFPVNNASFTCDGADLVVDFPALDTSASVRMVPA